MADYALVIGINDYTSLSDGGLPQLEAAVRDATAVADWLKRPDGGNISQDDCHLVTSSKNPLKPVFDMIDIELGAILDKAEKSPQTNGCFYFYFSGHGLGVDDNVTDNALCLANWSIRRRNLALSCTGYRERILKFGLFQKVIFIADCCRNRNVTITPLPSTIQVDIQGPHLGATRYFIAFATQYQDQSFEIEMSPDEPTGVFTQLLLKGLEGAAANENGEVDADSLKKYLDKETPTEANKLGLKQIPEISHTFNASNRLVFKRPTTSFDLLCQIKLNAQRVGPVDLLNGAADIVDTFTPNGTRTFTKRLGKGLYLLKDRSSPDTKPFQIEILPGKTEEHVEF